MSVYRSVLCASLLLLSLTGCPGGPLREEVIAQGTEPDGQIVFDLVKVDDAVLTTLLDRPQPPFSQRFKKYEPPAELKIAVGDIVSVIIWESAANGLFGNSITQFSFPAGAAARLQTGQASLGGASGMPGGMAVTPGTLAQLFGGSAAAALGGPGGAAGGTLGSLQGSRVEQFIGIAQQSGRPGTRIPDQRVGSDGAISVPYAGRLKVAGNTTNEVERKIEKVLGPKALEPQALVIVKDSIANSVSVTGEIVGGKRVPLSPGGDRLMDVIAAAGGIRAEAIALAGDNQRLEAIAEAVGLKPPQVQDTIVRLSRDGVTASVPLATLVADPEQNIYAKPGDVLALVQQRRTLSVFGATGKNTAVTFTSEKVTMEEALAKAGGLLDERADPRAVFLFRYEPVDVVRALGQPLVTGAPKGVSPVLYRFDLQEAKSYLLARRFPVQDRDVIFVSNAATVPINYAFQAISLVTGPVTNALLLCRSTSSGGC